MDARTYLILLAHDDLDVIRYLLIGGTYYWCGVIDRNELDCVQTAPRASPGGLLMQSVPAPGKESTQ